MKKRENLPLNYREKQTSRISFAASVVVLILLVILFHQMDYHMIQKPAQIAAELEAQQKQAEEKRTNAPVTESAKIIAVGDNLFQSLPLDTGRYESGMWNYDHVYDHIKNKIRTADAAIIAQETVFTSNHEFVSTSDPEFATPTEVGDAMANAGFNVIAGASNHVDDMGSTCISQTLEYWSINQPNTLLLGLHDAGASTSVKMMDINNIHFAFLNYTYGTNGYGADSDSNSMIDLFDKEQIAAAVSSVRDSCDVIIFVAHWGDNDDTMPSEYQKQWATFLMKQGVDVVIGSHPHVLQPYGTLSDDAGNQMLIYYSLGNFVTGQLMLDNNLGGLAEFIVRKTTTGDDVKIEIVNPKIEATIMHNSYTTKECGVYLLSDYTDALAATHVVSEIGDETFNLEVLRNRFDSIMNANVTPSNDSDLVTSRPRSSSGDENEYEDADYENSDYDDEDYSEDDYDEEG